MANSLEATVKALGEENAALRQEVRDIVKMIQPIRDENERLKNTPPNNDNSTDTVCRVTAKLPEFWPERPKTWFRQVESQFAISGIKTDQSKYDYVVAKLETRHVAEIEDIINDPPAKDKYQYLKDELIRRTSTSAEQRVRQLISDEELGDRKPTQFLRHLRHLSGSALTDQNFLRQLWLRRLPEHVQAILVAQSELPLDKIAELADKIIEIPSFSAPVLHQHAVAAVSVQPTIVAATAQPTVAAVTAPAGLEYVYKRLDELSSQIAALQMRQGRNINKSRTRSQSRAEVCRFHKKGTGKEGAH